MITFNPGDKVHYLVNGGWGGGATRRCAAVVNKLHGATATIALFDRTARHIITKRVKLTSLEPRETTLILDVEVAKLAALNHRE